jgi:hypothetical protein
LPSTVAFDVVAEREYVVQVKLASWCLTGVASSIGWTGLRA